MEEEKKQELKARGNKALILNIIFFVVLFLGIFMVSFAGLTATAVVISVVFIASLLYIYYS